jgi:hypothetical protein
MSRIVSAHLSRADITEGAALLVTDIVRPQDRLAVECPDNSRFECLVHSLDSSHLHLIAGQRTVMLDVWQPDDDPLPRMNGDEDSEPTCWTVTSVHGI